MKSIVLAAIVAAASLITFGSAAAQTSGLVTVNVPFAFAVGETAAPAGKYMIVATPNSPLVTLQKIDGGRAISTFAIADTPQKDGVGKLVFHRYGDQFFLSSISSPHSFANLHFAQTKAEKRARTRVEVAGLVAADPVIVTLN